MSVYHPEAKRRKTEVEREAEKAKKAEQEALAASVDPTAEWAIGQRQPWAEKQVQPARPTEEQLAWLKEEGFIKEEEEGEKVRFLQAWPPCALTTERLRLWAVDRNSKELIYLSMRDAGSDLQCLRI